MKRYRHIHILIFYLVLLLFGQTAKANTDAYLLMPPDTSNPRATMKVFMDSMNRAYQISLVKGYKREEIYVHLNRAALCLDLSEIAPNVVQDVAAETALLLKEVFDRIQLPPNEEIPGKEIVELDGLKSWTIPNTTIVIDKVEKGPRKGEFLFSTGTVARVREFYDRVEEILVSIARHNNMVAFVPEPRVRFRNFGDSSLQFELLCWAQRPEERDRLIHGLNHQIYKAFEAADIQIPFPQRDIHLHSHPKNSE